MANTLQEFATLIMNGAENVGSHFDQPDDDWASIIHIESDGEITVGLVDNEFFANENRKEMLVSKIGAKLEQMGASKVGFINSTWMKIITKEEMESGNYSRPSEDPNRTEGLALVVMDSKDALTFMAEIKRDGTNPPTLGEWKMQAGHFESRWLDWQTVLS